MAFDTVSKSLICPCVHHRCEGVRIGESHIQHLALELVVGGLWRQRPVDDVTQRPERCHDILLGEVLLPEEYSRALAPAQRQRLLDVSSHSELRVEPQDLLLRRDA
eukprot:6059804-Prymnesium_polylepis.1